MQRVFTGPLNRKMGDLPDLTARRSNSPWSPAIALMFVLGLYPQLILGVINSTAIAMVELRY